MPEYIWELACGQLDDGEYVFPEGVLTVRNGFVSWKDGLSDKELLPCPFCGSIPTLRMCGVDLILGCNHSSSEPYEDGVRVYADIDICADMRLEYNFETNEYEYTPEEIERCKNAAIKVWNTRVESVNDDD